LSKPRAWTLEETVQVLEKCAGRDVTIEQVAFDEHAGNPKVVEALSSHGPGRASRDWTNVFQAISDRETTIITGQLDHFWGDRPTILRPR